MSITWEGLAYGLTFAGTTLQQLERKVFDAEVKAGIERSRDVEMGDYPDPAERPEWA